MQTTHEINAEGKSIGRVATEAAKALIGKRSPDYTPNIRSDVRVTITNASKLVIREKMQTVKMYRTYSGYPGGARDESLRSLNVRKGHSAALKIAISRMLPRNSMRNARLKNLIIEN